MGQAGKQTEQASRAGKHGGQTKWANRAGQLSEHSGRAGRAGKMSGPICAVHCVHLTIPARKHAGDRQNMWLAQLFHNVGALPTNFGCHRGQQLS